VDEFWVGTNAPLILKQSDSIEPLCSVQNTRARVHNLFAIVDRSRFILWITATSEYNLFLFFVC